MATSNIPAPVQKSLDATKVDYVRLGKCGLRVSLPILGAMSFGHKDWMPWVVDDEEEVMGLLKGAYDRGLNTWDTANVYSNGLSEELIGKAIRKFELPRQKVVLLTKCYGTVGETPAIFHLKYPQIKDTRDYVNQAGLSRSAIFNAVEASLKRLQTDYIDLLQIHRFDYEVPIEETMEALNDLVRSGKVRYIGASSMRTYQFVQMQMTAEKHGWTKFVSMQNQYSLCNREEEREMNRFCLETGVGLIPWAPLYAGRLARPWGSDPTARSEYLKSSPLAAMAESDETIIKRVEEIAKKHDWKMSHVALAWVIQKQSIPIVGFSKLSRMDEAIEVRGKKLTEDEIKYLEEPYVPRNIVGYT